MGTLLTGGGEGGIRIEQEMEWIVEYSSDEYNHINIFGCSGKNYMGI